VRRELDRERKREMDNEIGRTMQNQKKQPENQKIWMLRCT